MNRIIFPLIFMFAAQVPAFAESEMIEKTPTSVHVRDHPKTGKPFVSIVDTEKPEAGYPFQGKVFKASRPDYRMLDHKLKKGEIPYDGPYSDRRKIYYFAAGLATAGVLAGTLIPIAPAAASAGGAGGGGLGYGVAGTAVATGTIQTALHQQKPDPKREDFKHDFEVRVKELNEPADESPTV